MKKRKIFITSTIIFFPIAACALEVGFPTVGGYTPGPSTGPAQWIRYIYLLSMGLVGLALVYTFAMAGIERMLGGANSGKITSSNKRIKEGLIGLLILLGSYIFLREINPAFVSIRNPQIEAGQSEGGLLDIVSSLVGEEYNFEETESSEPKREGETCSYPNECGPNLTCTGEKCVIGEKPSVTPPCTPTSRCTGNAKCFDNIKRECLVNPNTNYSGYCLTLASQYGESCEHDYDCAGAATTFCDLTEHKCRLKSGTSMTCP